MLRWSLRTKLVAVVAVASLPIVAIAAWHSHEGAQRSGEARLVVVGSAADLAVSRHRELIEASRRFLLAACSDEAVRRSAEPDAGPAELDRCESYLAQLMQRFPHDYSAAVVTNETGVARCSSSPTAAGLSLGDREIFRRVREGASFAVGSYIASRVTPRTIIPIAMPIQRAEQFRGMCAIGISLKVFSEFVTGGKPGGAISVVLVDRQGAPVGGNAEAAVALPVPARIASAIARNQSTFSDYGQDGSLYDVRLAALADDAMFVVAAVPVPQGVALLAGEWAGLVLTVLALLVVLAAVFLGVDWWAVRPLREMQAFAARIGRGEETKLVPSSSWGPDMVAVGEGITGMAIAIASREKDLHAGLEQRDHMLREIHHRVKNNLQMISSLLNLQAGEIRSPRIRRYFADAQNRVLTLSILHRHLYERSSWSLVDFQQFISDLVRQLAVGRPGVRQAMPRFHIRAPIMAVGPDTAIPVGLIVTEAVSGALAHDFAGVATPEIRIDATEKESGEVELVIEDNGRATEGSAGLDRGGFSLTLIRGLAAQLGGEALVLANHEGGTRVVVTFPFAIDETSDG